MPGTTFHLLAPIAFLLEALVPAPPAVPDEGVDPVLSAAAEEWQAADIPEGVPMSPGERWLAGQREGGRFLIQQIEQAPAEQVRIDQRLIIRIAPRAPQRDPYFDRPQRTDLSHFHERKTNRCLPVQAIAGVQVDDSRLILHMRDRRIYSANLEKSCRPRDFYSGFYVEKTRDGMVCAGRDAVHSRAGATCAISRLRQLVPDDD